MRINDLSKANEIQMITKYHENMKLTGVFCGDLLSHVMANIKEGNVLLTVISNFNVLAIAHLMNVPCVLFTSGIKPKPELIQKAEEESIALATTQLDTATAIKLLYETFSL